MPNKEPVYTKHIHILVKPEQHDFVNKELNGGISHHVRQMIDATMGIYDKQLTELEKEYAQVEPRYLFLKKRIDELKQEKMRQEDEVKTKEKRIEEAHTRLLEALKRNNWKPERIPKSTYKVYSDFSGQTVEELMDWVKKAAERRGELE